MKKAERQELEISRYVDGEASPRVAEDVRARLSESPGMAEEEAAFREIGDLLRREELPQGKPPEVAWNDVRRAIRLDEEAPGSDSILGSRLHWAAATMAMVFLGLGVLLFHSRPVTVAAAPAEVEWVETEVPGAMTMVYQDDETGLTVIWMMEEDETNHDKLDS